MSRFLMTLLTFVFAILSWRLAQAESTGSAGDRAEICAQGPSEFLLGRLIDESATRAPAALTGGLRHVTGLPDVRHLLQAEPHRKLCFSAVILGKNIYQYHEILFRFRWLREDGGESILPVLFQTASIQAHHNAGPRPWVGLPRAFFRELLEGHIAALKFVEATAATPETVFAHLDSAAVVERGTLSSLALEAPAGERWTLVTRMESQPHANPFLSVFFPKAVILRERAGRTEIAPLPAIHELRKELWREISRRDPMEQNPDHRATLLGELAR